MDRDEYRAADTPMRRQMRKLEAADAERADLAERYERCVGGCGRTMAAICLIGGTSHYDDGERADGALCVECGRSGRRPAGVLDFTARAAMESLSAAPFERAADLRDGLQPMTGDVDLFTGEVVDLELRRAGARGVQGSMF